MRRAMRRRAVLESSGVARAQRPALVLLAQSFHPTLHPLGHPCVTASITALRRQRLAPPLLAASQHLRDGPTTEAKLRSDYRCHVG